MTSKPPSSSSSDYSTPPSSTVMTQQPLPVPVGRHILLEYYQIPQSSLVAASDSHALQQYMITLIKQAGMTFLGRSCHVFPAAASSSVTDSPGLPAGVTCVFLLSESHISLHTWPEYEYAALDIFTCGTSSHPEIVEQGLQELLQPGLVVRQERERGGLDLATLTPEQRKSKVLHTFVTNSQDGESLQQQFYQVPVLHASSSAFQSLAVIEVPGQMGRCLLLDATVQFCAHDLDAYTDHMARYPLQLLQALQLVQQSSCNTSAGTRTSPAAGYYRRSGAGNSGAAGNAGSATTAASTRSSQQPEDASTASAAMIEMDAGLLLLPKPNWPVAGSSSVPGHITCRKSLLEQPFLQADAFTTQSAENTSKTASADAGVSKGAKVLHTAPPRTSTGCQQQHQHQQRRKLRVLLVGGGDGWIAGHLISCYGDWVESVTAVEIDRAVSEVTERFFGKMMYQGSPFKNPRIHWEYTDAFEWVMQRAARCSAGGAGAGAGAGAAGATGSDSVPSTRGSSSGPEMTAQAHGGASADTAGSSGTTAAIEKQRKMRRHLLLRPGSSSSLTDALGTSQDHLGNNAASSADTIGASSSSSRDILSDSPSSSSSAEEDCEALFDVAIIDSTDFSFAAASKLHSAPFYLALHKLMRPQAAMIQIVEIYMRLFERDFQSMEAALRQSGWSGVGRSSVYTPSYSGEALMLHAVKHQSS